MLSSTVLGMQNDPTCCRFMLLVNARGHICLPAVQSKTFQTPDIRLYLFCTIILIIPCLR